MAILATCAYGQGKRNTFSFTPQVGVSLGKQNGFTAYSLGQNGLGSAVTNELNYQPDARYKAGFTAGLEVSYQLTNQWAISLGAFYTEAGSKYKDFDEIFSAQQSEGNQSATTDEGLLHGYSYTNQHNSFGYVTIPLMANYYVVKDFAIKAGLEIGFITTAKTEWDQTELTYNPLTNVTTFGTPTTHEMDLKDESKTTTMAIPVGASYEYEHVVLDARYHIPLTKSMKNNDTHNRLFTFTVGYRF